jgi:hypothetical protein
MTITNHLLVGAIIGLTVSNPVVAIVLAFASHFAMDALPHFGYPGQKGYTEVLKYRLSHLVIVGTFITSLAVVAILAITGHPFALLTGLVAASPDAIGLYNYLKYDKKNIPARGFIKHFQVNFHRKIQRYERPWGLYIEIAATIILGLIFIKLL